MIKILEKLPNRDLEILNIIQKIGPITKKHIQTIANIKLTTLNRIMKTLEDKKVVMVYGESDSTGGRKAVEYDVTQTGAYVIGITIKNLCKTSINGYEVEYFKKRRIPYGRKLLS